MKTNKRGVSDVVTTVLIILLVLAAVAIVGSIVLRTTTNAGKQVDKGVLCINNNVVPVSCKYTGAGPSYATTAAVRRDAADATISSHSSVVTVLSTGGVVTNGAVINGLLDGRSFSQSITATGVPSSMYVTTVFTLNDGSTQSCTSQPLACTT